MCCEGGLSDFHGTVKVKLDGCRRHTLNEYLSPESYLLSAQLCQDGLLLLIIIFPYAALQTFGQLSSRVVPISIMLTFSVLLI